MLAYLCAVNNPQDDLRLRADHQQPAPGHRQHHRRAGPGHRRRSRASPCRRSSRDAAAYPELQKRGRQAAAVHGHDRRADRRQDGWSWPCRSSTSEVCDETGYIAMLWRRRTTWRAGTRLENVRELLTSSILGYLEQRPEDAHPGGLPGRDRPVHGPGQPRSPTRTA